MTERSVMHATFVVERNYDAAPARVFAAFADPAAKARWFVGPDEWRTTEFEMDFLARRYSARARAPRFSFTVWLSVISYQSSILTIDN
jgi:uncharacterized protein YndB with AHSA1/START domain